MASRPGIRTLNNTGYNSVSRPTSPANYRGSGVRQISPTLAGTKRRTEVLATGRRGIIPQNVNTAATALGTVFTKGALSAMEATSEGAKALTENIRRLVPDNVPLVNLPTVTEPIAELPGVNVPIITNPVQFVDATIKTSQYSDDLVNEARIRAQKGDILSGIYAGTADTIVKGANDLYERVNKPGYTPTSKALAGVIKAGAGAVATVPAILQAGNYLVNPQRLVYNGDIPKTVSGVNVDGMPKISGVDSITISTDDVEVVNSVLGTAATSAGELAKEYIPKAVDAVKTEFRENPYGLAGQVLGGAVLAKGVGSAVPKRVKPRGIEGEASVKPTSQKPSKQTRPTKEEATPWVTAEYTIKAAAREAIINNLPRTVRRITQKDSGDYVYSNLANTAKRTATISGGLAAATVLSEIDSQRNTPLNIPQKVTIIKYSQLESTTPAGIVTRLPTKKEDMYKDGMPTRLPTKKEDMYKDGMPTRLPTKKEDMYKDGMPTRLPTKKEDMYKDGMPTRLPTKKEDMYKDGMPTRLPTKKEDMYKSNSDSGLVTSELNYRDSNNTSNRNKYDIIPRSVDANASSNIMKYDLGTVRLNRNTEENKNKRAVANNNKEKSQNKNAEENAEANRTQNRAQNEFAYEYATVTAPRGSRGKRRIDIDIDLSRKPKKKAKRTKRTYAKRQIVNPIPWLWDEVPSFSRKLPKTVETVSVDTLLA